MILKNNLYTIKETKVDAQQGVFLLQLHPEHVIYQAHFPGQPITPGVCIVQMGKELLEDYLAQMPDKPWNGSVNLQVVKVKNVKFLSVISPDESLEITYQIGKIVISEDTGEVKTQIVVLAQNKAKAKISMTCKRL